MDASERLSDLVTRSTNVARDLFRVSGVRRSTRELGRAVAYWAVAIRRLSASGPAAWADLDSRPARAAAGSGQVIEPDSAPAEDAAAASEPEAGLPHDPPPSYAAELDLLTALVMGDLCLDALAHAELERRQALPPWTPGGRIPSWWPEFMTVVEEGSDAMRGPARRMDLSIALARDLLVAHPDPHAVHMPSFGSSGGVNVYRPVIDDERRRRAEAMLRDIGTAEGIPVTGHYYDLLDRLLGRAPLLEFPARAQIKDALRVGGFYSPRLTDTIPVALGLFEAHAERVARMEAEGA